MASEQCVAGCEVCRRNTIHISTEPDCPHVLHLLATLFLCGLWLPIWVINAAWSSYHSTGWRCSACGRQNRS